MNCTLATFISAGGKFLFIRIITTNDNVVSTGAGPMDFNLVLFAIFNAEFNHLGSAAVFSFSLSMSKYAIECSRFWKASIDVWFRLMKIWAKAWRTHSNHHSSTNMLDEGSASGYMLTHNPENAYLFNTEEYAKNTYLIHSIRKLWILCEQTRNQIDRHFGRGNALCHISIQFSLLICMRFGFISDDKHFRDILKCFYFYTFL